MGAGGSGLAIPAAAALSGGSYFSNRNRYDSFDPNAGGGIGPGAHGPGAARRSQLHQEQQQPPQHQHQLQREQLQPAQSRDAAGIPKGHGEGLRAQQQRGRLLSDGDGNPLPNRLGASAATLIPPPPLVGVPARAISLGHGGSSYAQRFGLDDTMNETYGSDPNFPAYLSPYNDDGDDGPAFGGLGDDGSAFAALGGGGGGGIDDFGGLGGAPTALDSGT